MSSWGPKPCEGCGGDEHHGFGCRNQPVSESYWLGYRHGQRTASYGITDHDLALRQELRLIGTTNRPHRAFALGELRGYRQAQDRPNYARPDRGMQVPA